jgi:hypothetical protein
MESAHLGEGQHIAHLGPLNRTRIRAVVVDVGRESSPDNGHPDGEDL